MSIYALGDRRPSFGEGSWIAHNATVIGSVTAGRNVSIWYNVVVRGDNDPITIGDDTNIQDGSVLHNDDGIPLTIGRHVTVGHMAMLHGCTIGDGSLIGIGSTLLNGVKIGKNCIIGAHTLLTEGKEIPDNSLVVGSPGRVIRTHGEDVAELLQASADHYVENWKKHAAELREVG